MKNQTTSEKEVFEVIVSIEKCWLDDEGDVIDSKTVDYEIWETCNSDKEAREFIAAMKASKAPKPCGDCRGTGNHRVDPGICWSCNGTGVLNEFHKGSK